MRRIGFSTGALAKGDFLGALRLLRDHAIDVVELSALRFEELAPLAAALPKLDLRGFTFISVHAPSRFDAGVESCVIDDLARFALRGYPVIVHPDVIFTPAKWAAFGRGLLIENMDRRKRLGRTADEMREIFDALPEARFCFDIGHARQVDPSMLEARLLLDAFGAQLAEVHMSEVNTSSRHDPISSGAVLAFKSVAPYIPNEVPIILEPLMDQGQSDIPTELERAREALRPVTLAVA